MLGQLVVQCTGQLAAAVLHAVEAVVPVPGRPVGHRVVGEHEIHGGQHAEDPERDRPQPDPRKQGRCGCAEADGRHQCQRNDSGQLTGDQRLRHRPAERRARCGDQH